MSHIFFGTDGKLRSMWRFFLFLFLFWFLAIPIQALLINLISGSDLNNLFLICMQSLSFLGLALALGWFLGKILENQGFRALGLYFDGECLKEISLGILLGGISLSFAVLTSITFGNMQFTLNENLNASLVQSAGVNLIVFLIAAASEESLFRGYMLQTLVRSNLCLAGTLITSFLFASSHNLNPNSSHLSWVNTFIAGIWLAVAYLKTKKLWLSIAMHASWNWFQSTLFGINVSGITEFSNYSVFQPLGKGNELITGGDYGIEGGISCSISLLLSILLILIFPLSNKIELTKQEGTDR
jgi:membrane protease YdiL (CAAX protease family)